MFEKRGQVAIFVIIAVVIVALILLFFAIRSGFFQTIPEEFRPVYSSYTACIEQATINGADLLGSQGGRINSEYIPGSDYAPFSSHLNFLGLSIPYWYYVSANGVIEENFPTKQEMESELEDFIAGDIRGCDFTSFYDQGFYVDQTDPEVDVSILDNKITVTINSPMVVSRDGESARKTTHEAEIESKLGEFYVEAREIYEKQKTEAFLENYAVDTLRLTMPVDGVEVQCSPEIWQTRELVDEFKGSLSANIASVKFKGGYYTLSRQEDEYFVVDKETGNSVNLVYLEDWPSKIEIYGQGVDQEIMIAEPVGNQEGLGVMGFCYVPYHFVYDVSFPVMIQVSDGLEIFQFPVVVVIDKNLPREANITSLDIDFSEQPDICGFAEGQVSVSTFDRELNPVNANISYECFDSSCYLGQTQSHGIESTLDSDIPLCVNGFLVAKADGYAETRKLFSSNSESFSEIVLEREYNVPVELRVDGQVGGNSAVISFEGEQSDSAVFPEATSVSLKEGLYTVRAYVYGDSNVVIPASSKQQCYDVARGGILGFFGSTKEECVTIQVPETRIDYALIGGGTEEIYILESDLERGKIVVNVQSLPVPNSLEQLQYNYEVFGAQGLEVNYG